MKKLAIFLLALGIVSFWACKKKQKDSAGGEKLFTYNSLIADKDSIAGNSSTNLRANITGEGTFAWTANNGASILGSGAVVFFAACCAGEHVFTCTVTDKNNNSETKSVKVYVKP